MASSPVFAVVDLPNEEINHRDTEAQSGEAAKNLTTETPRHREEADEADSSWGEKNSELSSTEKKEEAKAEKEGRSPL